MECFKITPDCTLTALHTKEMLHATGLPQRRQAWGRQAGICQDATIACVMTKAESSLLSFSASLRYISSQHRSTEVRFDKYRRWSSQPE